MGGGEGRGGAFVNYTKYKNKQRKQTKKMTINDKAIDLITSQEPSADGMWPCLSASTANGDTLSIFKTIKEQPQMSLILFLWVWSEKGYENSYILV